VLGPLWRFLVDFHITDERGKVLGYRNLEELASILEEACQLAGLKAVVFSQWAQMGEMVEMRVRRMGLGCVRLHGGVPSAKRGDPMNRFREDEACQVFISTDAGGTDLNLQSASVLVNRYDPASAGAPWPSPKPRIKPRPTC